MKIFTKQLSNVLIKYRWIIIPFVPLLFVFLVLLLTFSPGGEQINPSLPAPTTTPTGALSKEDLANLNIPDSHLEPVDPEELKGLQKTELQSDGTTMYTVSSTNPQRPDLIQANTDGYPFFKRLVTPPNYPLSLTSFSKLYGSPKWIFTGSVFYGTNVRSYIYPELGVALIANPQTDQVLEQHIFPKTKVEEYIKKYGDDIPTQP